MKKYLLDELKNGGLFMLTVTPVKKSFSHSLLAVIALSAALFFYSTGFYDNWLLTWLAPLPVCRYAFHAPAHKTALAAFLAYSLGAMNQFGYLPLPLFASTTMLSAVAFTGAVLLFRIQVTANQRTLAPFVFAATWTAYEFLRSLSSSFGTFESLAYTQVLNLPVIQLASLTGIWGITFLLMLFPSSLAVLWHYRHNQSACRLITLLTGGLLTTVFLFGILRLYLPPNNAPILTIGLAAVPTTRELLLSQDAETITAALRRYSHSVSLLADAGAQVVLLPEKLASLTPSTCEEDLSILSGAASNNKITLIAGLSTQENQLYNAALILGPDGSLLQTYHKQHLLAAYENRYTPGRDLALLDVDEANHAGIAICKDMDFLQPAKEYSRQGVGILFVPALDFHADGWLHARVAIMRGVEGNYSVARAAQWGLLTVSDSRGRLLGATATDTAAEPSLLSKVPLGSGHSFYSLTGDWLAWLSLLLTVQTAIRLVWQKHIC